MTCEVHRSSEQDMLTDEGAWMRIREFYYTGAESPPIQALHKPSPKPYTQLQNSKEELVYWMLLGCGSLKISWTFEYLTTQNT